MIQARLNESLSKKIYDSLTSHQEVKVWFGNSIGIDDVVSGKIVIPNEQSFSHSSENENSVKVLTTFYVFDSPLNIEHIKKEYRLKLVYKLDINQIPTFCIDKYVKPKTKPHNLTNWLRKKDNHLLFEIESHEANVYEVLK